MNILAINFNHDGASAVLRNGELAGYVSTERFSRRKKHPGVRTSDLHNLLDQAGLSASQLDLVQLLNLNNMDSPDVVQLHGGDLKETWPDFWVNASFSRVNLLGSVLPCEVLQYPMHHATHAAASYFFSPFDSAVSFACDPLGAEAYFLRGTERLPCPAARPLVAPHVYNLAAAHLFGTGLMGAGKLMGLAPYGAGVRAANYASLSGLMPEMALRRLMEIAARDPAPVREGDRVLDAALAYHAQAFLEFELTAVFEELYVTGRRLGIEPNLCFSGGTALNSVANQRCFEASRFERLYLHPACGDDGTPIGAALLAWHHVFGQPKVTRSNSTAMYSCRVYDDSVAATVARFADRVVTSPVADDLGEAASMIADGKVIGWFQGASEIGPRALGNRSILADPRNPAMKHHLNAHVKRREGFRPFAPSVLREYADEWFGIDDSPFMLRVAPVRRKSEVPAIAHVDGTARVQTVAPVDNPRYHALIARFHEMTGIPMVLNTSFNGRDEPIVETPADAIECMLQTGLDAVVFPGLVVKPRCQRRA
ncbi:carbamoyltransferase C-terminal domain-containing protein [Burkholderia ubonensis]|uniref:Carbamoyltransferase n=1 Tax=Burkholderia ubonensis TaxID=101571 RepID=A0AAW3MMJ8_9BURK|nr:carbamoyltransferase C-terminal domain-containing protein [Burkholderia ubonensis]KVL13196.1 hypothetical protein WJ45_33270 [Burkholderia ubonensis]KVO42581.1 hypothetical protein WJ75_04495 [Burkholderia ubonensis]KVP94105.1 hypothetical protein WJ96_13185 [Burkholderia ubonensis]KVQ49501.1 hypothetical protein WK04_06850 [Burkholderia ubonensis]KVX25325.1 hypothetical protein WL02_31110 [Burkholderia ubonensis]